VKRIIFTLCLYGLPLIASESTSHWMQEIVTEMKKVEAIAESIKMNEPYQPYIVTVFLGKDLERIGVSNLQEALELVPGVDIATDNMDNKRAVFRGSNPYAYGQSKLFIDGVEVKLINFGKVLFTGWYGIYGNAVIIDHGYGVQSLYGHLSFIIVPSP